MLETSKRRKKDPPTIPKAVAALERTFDQSDRICLDSLEENLAWHQGRHPLESWHFAASLRGNDRHFSFRVHLVIVEASQGAPDISIGLCLMDQDTGWVREVETTVPLGDIVISGESLDIQTNALDIRGRGSMITITADLPDAYVELAGTVGTPILINNGEGAVTFLGAQHYKFAFPAMCISGAVTIMGKQETVSGTMWFNRQWGALPRRFSLARNPEHRQWISLYHRLNNGITMSVGQLWDFEADSLQTDCTILMPDGRHVIEHLDPLQMSDYVESRISGRRYPRHIMLSNEAMDTCLQISLPYKRREMVSNIGNLIKFEGKMTVAGYFHSKPVTGSGFVEMVGRWRDGAGTA